MKAAFSYWNGRIAPVFDVARQVHLVDSEAGVILSESDLILTDELQSARVIRLSELGVGVLVCGAISRPLHMMVESYGIHVVSFMAGDLNGIMDAWLRGALEDGQFAMPGCCGKGRRHFMQVAASGKGDELMRGRNRGGIGPRGSRGRDQRGGVDGENGFSFCVCPKCGHREQHQRGIPCVQRQCPQCGTALVRDNINTGG